MGNGTVGSERAQARGAFQGESPEAPCAASALSLDAARWRQLMDDSPLAIAVYGPDGTLMLANRRMAQMFGVTPEEERQLVGRYNLLEDEQNEAKGVAATIRRAFRGEAVSLPILNYVVPGSADAPERSAWIQGSLRPIFEADGSIREVLVLLQDVSDLEDARRHLDRQRVLLATQLAEVENLYDSSPVGLCLMDTDLRFVRVNEMLARINGRPKDDHLGRTLREVVPDLADELEPLYRRVIDTGEPVLNREIVGTTPADPEHERVWMVSYHPLKTDAGEVWGLDTVVQDVTTLKRAERALRESELRFREMAEHIRDAFWLYDCTEDQVIYASPAYEDIWGRAVTELYTDPEAWAECIHPDEAQAARETLARVAAEGVPQALEYRIVRPDGEMRWISDRAFAIRDADGTVVRIAGIAEDVTARKRALEALRQSEEHLRTLVNHAPAILWALDAEGRFTLSEGRALRALGLRPGEVVGQSACDLYADHADVIECVRRSLAGETVEAVTTVEGVTFETRHVPRLDSEGNIAGSFGVAIDVTERERAAEERRRLESQIQEAQRLESLGVLAGGIAHDFNNLLMGMLGNADLALSCMSAGAPGRRLVEQIEITAQRAAELTNQMLAYSGKGRFVVEPIDLNQIVTEMGDLLRTVISKKAVLRFDVAEGLPAIEADASQLRQVAMNLITNASEALEERSGTIVVHTECRELDRVAVSDYVFESGIARGRYVVLRVSDTGVGMDEETLRRVFDPFFTTKFAGRGLGLAGVLGIVRGHKGAIRVQSRTGGGSSFEILFPASARPARSAHRRDAAPPIEASGETVLVVDDDEMVAGVARAMLEDAGYAVEIAHDGQAGLDRFRERADEIALVLLDMTMPRLSGEEACVRMRAIRPDLPVLLMSGYSEQEARGRFAGLGLAGFVQKPYRAAELLEHVREALRHSCA